MIGENCRQFRFLKLGHQIISQFIHPVGGDGCCGKEGEFGLF